jgi:hypothetical protein
MPYDEISLEGMDIDEVGWTGSRLRVSFGHGYGAFALTGNAAGLHRWKISSGGLLPDRDGADYLPIDGVSRFEYYYEFFIDHTTGAEEIFIIQWRGKKYHACFAEPTQSFEQFTSDLYNGGVEIRQRRVAGFLYNADGSMDANPPSVPVLTSLIALSAFALKADWLASTDLPGDIYTLAGYRVRIDGTTIIDVGNVLTYTYSFFGPGSIHQFEVQSYDNAPTPNYSAWSNALSATTDASGDVPLVDDDGEFLLDDDGAILVDG